MRNTLVVASIWVVVVAAALTAQERPAIRVEPAAPDGAGGTLAISIDPSFCNQPGLRFYVMREAVDGPVTFGVFEAPPVDPCTWVVAGLWPGKYNVFVRRESPRQTLAFRTFEMVAGATVVEKLDVSRTEIAGLVTIDGARAFDLQELRVTVNQLNGRWETELPVDGQGEYRGQLDFEGDAVLLVGGEAMIPTLNRLKVEPGFNRYDIDFPAGVIKVTIIPPPNLTKEFRILCRIEREAPRATPNQRPTVSEHLRQITMDATRTYVIVGQGYGRYVIRAGTDAGRPADSKPLAEVVVNLTSVEPRQDIVLDLSHVVLTRYPTKPINLDCPPPRTAECVNGPSTR